MGVKALGAYLKYFRKQRGLSLTDIADDLDTSSSQIYRVEEGQVHPEIKAIALQMTDFDLGKWAEMGSKLLAERNRTQ